MNASHQDYILAQVQFMAMGILLRLGILASRKPIRYCSIPYTALDRNHIRRHHNKPMNALHQD